MKIVPTRLNGHIFFLTNDIHHQPMSIAPPPGTVAAAAAVAAATAAACLSHTKKLQKKLSRNFNLRKNLLAGSELFTYGLNL